MSTETIYPESYDNSKVKDFVQRFYAASDVKPPSSTAEVDPYISYFTDKADICIKSKATGGNQIAELRQNMWTSVATRKHVVEKVYPYSTADSAVQEIFLNGIVYYKTNTGDESSAEWAARMTFDSNDGSAPYKLRSYYVYMM